MLITDSCWVSFFPNKKETIYSDYTVSFMWNILSCINVLQMMLLRKVSDPGNTTEQLGSWLSQVYFISFLEHLMCAHHWIKYVHNRIKPTATKGSERRQSVAYLLMVMTGLRPESSVLIFSLPGDFWTCYILENETLYVSFIWKRCDYTWEYSLTHIISALNVMSKKMLGKQNKTQNIKYGHVHS